MEHRNSMTPYEVEVALESAYEAAGDTDFEDTGAALVIGSTCENAKAFRDNNIKATGSHDIDIVMMPRSDYNLDRFLNEFTTFWRNYDEKAREAGMHTSTYSDSSHEVEANWITEQTEGAEGKIPGHALLFPSLEDVKEIAPQGFYETVKDQHIPLHGSLDQVNEEPTPGRLGEFIGEYHGPSGALISESFPEEIQWRKIEQIAEYVDEHYGDIVDQETTSEVQNEIQDAAKNGLETTQTSPQELHDRLTSGINPNAAEMLS